MANAKYKEWLSPKRLLLLEAWARDSLSEEQIAEKMDICSKTLRKWKKKYPELSEALDKNREMADVEVEKALQQKALGYTVAVKKVYKCREIQYSPEGKKISEADVLREGVDEVYVPADMRAQSFWLKNRRPERWRDKADHTAEESARVEIVDDLDGGEDG